MLTEKLKIFFKDENDYPFVEDNAIIKRFLKLKNTTFDKLMEIAVIDGTEYIFVCLRDDMSKPFPGYIGDTKIICCFDKECVKNANRALVHILKEDKILETNRLGFLPHFISDIIGNDYKRFGFQNLSDILYELYKLNNDLIFFKFENISQWDIELVDLIFKRKNKKGKIIVHNNNRINFYVSTEKILQYINNKKINILDIYAIEFENKYNVLSFIFKINFVIFKYSQKFDVKLFTPTFISSISYENFIFIHQNENGIFETIMFEKKIYHSKGPLIDYIKFYYKEHENVLIV